MNDSVYDGLSEEHADDARWAYGTGFHDELSGVDRDIPSGVDGADLGLYCQMLGDDALVLAQRLAEWCSRAPELEEDVALANIGLDLLGQARLLLTRAGEVDGTGRSEDDFAYLRPADQFRNLLLVELDCGPGPGGDFAVTMARLLVFSSFRLSLLYRLQSTVDPVIAAVAAKGVKELAYHRDHAAQWVLRLGDGTAESHRRMQAAVDRIWPYLDELYAPHPVVARLIEVDAAVDPADVRAEVEDTLHRVLRAATLSIPSPHRESGELSGRDGRHTPELAEVLGTMQELARSLPGAVW
ncbi:phenylacetate-CoA oxygenase subunit PaaI [Pseudonocardiaceae bacterium YIM PH 21723]|nr:phenylacetate-CoA oxygenase subunit PaaI [Pseudonocardiaceae bacterium YIM PH 21723]